nr:hypothetical protein [Candidatus Freyarchaeota archaeon]
MIKDKCNIEFTDKGLEIKGPCAQDFFKLFEAISEASKEAGKEISAYACVNPKTGKIEKLVLGKVGTPTSTSFPHGRVCLKKERQISLHTHPVSGEAKFSNTDAITITSRMNDGMDDGSCVIGVDAIQCLLRALIPKRMD